MNLKPAVWVLLLLALVTLGMQSGIAAQNTKKSLISTLVRNLGYGAAIHNFKNYELRADDKYRVNAENYFTTAEQTIAALRNTGELNAVELGAVDEISQMIDAYQAGLPVIQELYASNVSKVRVHKKIDESVMVDDAKALAALEKLRRPYRWSHVEEVEHTLGYGGAIHNFKNFVIRGQDQDYARANATFAAARETLMQLAKDKNLDNEEQQAVNNIRRVVVKYLEALPEVQNTLAPARHTHIESLISMTMVAADRIAVVSDTPALDGLSLLRNKQVN
jgi:hypothetical protein